jgi:hypothetical protein
MFQFNDRIDLAPTFTPAVLGSVYFLQAREVTDCVPFGFSLSASLAGSV